ncbi:hypothetical protein [Pseudidiomarina insulisalsae]|uniref:PEGA domain-containing protein n=1 Tax=Pseudidiomarina insulisalsae TaxID=575789 RepID=A0A432YMR5_9GAMM|nr:hypothetical protein [Pseudidiomarina insulisalsae]RUO62222.1 hypothetical protein CWI71_05060 [Pseudidiomarina insulisalsae]
MNKLIISAVMALTLIACAKQPTRMTEVVNDAPTANFKVANSAGLELWVDGVSFGALEQYSYPERAVELVPGEHLIEVRRNGQVIYSQRIYFSEATHRTLEI